jgi:tRNA dimethylallyltransferase
VGPTAAGKSALAVRLAREHGGEVLACDSTQIYRHFDIGTAKVPPGEQQGIAHHLTDLCEPEEVFTAGEYRLRAIAVLDDLRRRGKLPILTVGTGLYLRALLEGLADAPTRSEELRDRLRERASERGPVYLHRILARLDAEAARRIAPQDEPKLIRAIEVCILAKKPITEVHRAGRAPLEGWTPVKVGLNPPRQALYERIHQRVHAMLAAGWLDEVRHLATEIPATAKPFQFIGYGELRAYLQGKCSLQEAVAAIQQATRRYAKRQLTWFRREPAVHWLSAFGDDPATWSEARHYLQGQLPGIQALHDLPRGGL